MKGWMLIGVLFVPRGADPTATGQYIYLSPHTYNALFQSAHLQFIKHLESRRNDTQYTDPW